MEQKKGILSEMSILEQKTLELEIFRKRTVIEFIKKSDFTELIKKMDFSDGMKEWIISRLEEEIRSLTEQNTQAEQNTKEEDIRDLSEEKTS